MNLKNYIKNFGARIKNAWDALDYVPNCPCCKGTGESNDMIYSDFVWWKGQLYSVCGRCQGTGKL